jgi:hypothetical protein
MSQFENVTCFKYYFSVIDDCSHYTSTFPLRFKSDVRSVIRDSIIICSLNFTFPFNVCNMIMVMNSKIPTFAHSSLPKGLCSTFLSLTHLLKMARRNVAFAQSMILCAHFYFEQSMILCAHFYFELISSHLIGLKSYTLPLTCSTDVRVALYISLHHMKLYFSKAIIIPICVFLIVYVFQTSVPLLLTNFLLIPLLVVTSRP